MKTSEEIFLYIDKSACCGCGVCSIICPQNAIRISTDEFGCQYPVVDKLRCVKCGKCIHSCNYKHTPNLHSSISYWIAINRQQEIRKASTSGGFFSAISQFAINAGGSVYGCAWVNSEEVLEARHIRVNSLEDLSLIRCSKYVQSNISFCLEQVKDDILKNRLVVFSGTPCQIDGLYGYLNNKKYDNLITIEVICHGVPGSGLFKDYLRNVEKKEKGKITAIRFRDKDNGGWSHGGIYEIRKNKIYKKKIYPNISSYYNLFLNGTLSRINCYSCPYASLSRCADFTIGDCWGINEDELMAESCTFQLKEGVSCVIVNTQKANQLIHYLHDYIYLFPTSYEKIRKGNIHLSDPTKKNVKHDYVMELYRKDGYEAVDKWFNRRLGIKKFLYKLWNLLPLEIKKKIKNDL